jgi:hypothetical protein
MQDSTTPTATKPARKAKRVIVGVIAGGVITSGLAFGAMSANAATTPTPSAASAAATTDAPAPSGTSHGHGRGLNLSGTVTAVGTGSVTIKTATATTEYAVSATSDIDKNGEAALGDLVVGDAITFSTTTTANNTVTVDKLHTGNEALNKAIRTTPSRR